MDALKENLILNAVCVVLSLLALAVAVYNLVTGQVLSTGVDGLFMTLICLLLALIFALNPLLALRSGMLSKSGKSSAGQSGKQSAAS